MFTTHPGTIDTEVKYRQQELARTAERSAAAHHRPVRAGERPTEQQPRPTSLGSWWRRIVAAH